MSRYIERAENTARLVNTYHFLTMDLPRNTGVSWDLLPTITGGKYSFSDHYQRHDERNTVKFLLADSFNPGALVNSISNARENCRTCRETLPGSAWEVVNELYHYSKNHVMEALPRRGRFNYLTEIIHRSQQLTGLLAGTMSHDHAYDFIRIGRNLERADMTTRVVDIGAMSLKNPDEAVTLDVHVWTSMLRALGAYQMYRKDVQHGVKYEDVVRFLLQNALLPRSVAFCINEVEESVGKLPQYKDTLKPIRSVHRSVQRIAPDKLDAHDLHKEVDHLQVGISEIHNQIRKTWFA